MNNNIDKEARPQQQGQQPTAVTDPTTTAPKPTKQEEKIIVITN